MGTLIRRYWTKLITICNRHSLDRGSALVIALLIMLALILLGLALLLQSNTEYAISLNERDSTAALANADATLQLAKAFVKDYSVSNPNFTEFLVGPDGDPATTNDNGIMQIKTISGGITKNDLNDDCSVGSTTCEMTRSVIESVDSIPYEVFRIGVNRDGATPANKSGWDGPRGLVYVRADDNHDDEPLLNDPNSDQDRRILVTVRSEYPVYASSTGTVIQTGAITLKTVGVSRRVVQARFGPMQLQPAILTDGDLLITGSLKICGECGSAHANEDAVLDPSGTCSQEVCGTVTSTASAPTNGCTSGTNVQGGTSQAPNIPVPIANPYGADYVPKETYFAHAGDTELAGFPKMQKTLTPSDPGASKYFALVVNKTGPIHNFVYKAYWDFDNNHWTWRPIDNLDDNTFEVLLDDAGRVTNSGTESLPNGSTFSWTPDPFADSPVPDGGSNQFYGIKMTPVNHGTSTCTADGTLGGVTDNDNTRQAFITYPPVAGGNPPNRNANPSVPALPNVNDGDTNPDFVPADNIAESKAGWNINANTVYSPLYNAVIFIYGHFQINGNPASNFEHSGGSTTPPGNKWRVTFIAFGNADFSGTPAYAPAVDSLPFFIVAGRDLHLTGNAGGYEACPGSGANCTDPPIGNTPPYAGIAIAHEQALFSGNVAMDGILIAEDAATCQSHVQTDGNGIKSTGSAAIHYDCVHPPNPFAEAVTLISWEEIQRH